MSELPTVAIMGANSQIARCLIEYYARQPEANLKLFSHRPKLCAEFIARQGIKAEIHAGYDDFASSHFDLLLNCVGAGTPTVLQQNHLRWFTLLESFDNLALSQLRHHCPEALYVNFSSGAVYGRQHDMPANTETRHCLAVNQIKPADYYAIVRLNAEAKHRAHADLRIVDLRVFSFFCRHTPPDAGYLLSDILRALLDAETLSVSPQEMVRDYVHPDDLGDLIELCRKQPRINRAIDVYSAAPCRKSEILALFQREFNLQFVFSGQDSSPNGVCDVYCSDYQWAASLGYAPRYNSLAGLRREMRQALQQQALTRKQS